MHPWKLSETRLADARHAAYDVAVLPVGATEAHGLHLPYATDTIQVEAVAERACERAAEQGARVLLLPAIPYGVNENNLGFPWTMSLKPSTLFAVIGDLVDSAEEHAISKFVILNGHGGNEFKPLLRELFRQCSARLFLIDWWTVAREAHDAIFVSSGEHADEMETSLLLHLRPDLVDMAVAGDGATRPPRLQGMGEGWVWIARPWHLLTETSGVGDPSLASHGKGAQFIEAVAAKLADFLVELSAAEVDDTFPYGD
jgi:creatinine amidohydrolase